MDELNWMRLYYLKSEELSEEMHLRNFNFSIKQDRSGIRRQGGKIPLVVVNVIVVQKGHMLLVQIIAGNPVVGTGEGKHNIKNGDHCHAIRKERKARFCIFLSETCVFQKVILIPAMPEKDFSSCWPYVF